MLPRGKLRPGLFFIATVPALLIGGSAALAQSEGRWKSGEEVYAKVCAYCHETGVGPVLKGRGFPPEAFAAFVRQGPLAMPAFRPSEIDDQALQALGEYLANAPAPKQ